MCVWIDKHRQQIQITKIHLDWWSLDFEGFCLCLHLIFNHSWFYVSIITFCYGLVLPLINLHKDWCLFFCLSGLPNCSRSDLYLISQSQIAKFKHWCWCKDVRYLAQIAVCCLVMLLMWRCISCTWKSFVVFQCLLGTLQGRLEFWWRHFTHSPLWFHLSLKLCRISTFL